MIYSNQTINLQLNDIIVAIRAENEPTFTTDRIEEILADTSVKHLQLKIKRPLPPWKVTSQNHDTEYVDEKRAKILIATHKKTCIKLIALNPLGIIAEAEINPVLPDRFKGEKEETKYANDTTKYLGMQLSASRGKDPHNQSIKNNYLQKHQQLHI
jgi:hypothetical protein